jgi:CheY-like chemotaxis protein
MGHTVHVTTPDTHKIPITILICEDDEDDRMRARRALEEARLSNTLRFVEDGEQLLDYLYQRGEFAGETGKAPRPGLILLNLDAPNMGGREALKVIKRDPTLRDIPVVVLRAPRLIADIVQPHDLDVSSFITKPVTFSGLVEALSAADRYWLEIVEAAPVPA